MSDVEFYEEGIRKNDFTTSLGTNASVPGTVRFLVRMGIVKNPKVGYFMIVGATLLFFILAIVIFYLYVFK